jgi:hypothetical protein
MSPAPTRTGSALAPAVTGDGEAASGCCGAAADGDDEGVDCDGERGAELAAAAVGDTVGGTAKEARADLDARGGVEIAPAIEADGPPDDGAERAASEANPKSSASVATNARTASGT